MKSPLVIALAVANIALFGSLASRHLGPDTAEAQVGGGGEYLMIAGEAVGVPADIVYVVDTRNGAVIGTAYNINTSRLEALPGVDLARILNR